MAKDPKKPGRLLGTTRSPNGKRQYYAAPSQKGIIQRAEEAMDAYNTGRIFRKKGSMKVWHGVVEAAAKRANNLKNNAAKENASAKKRIGKPRGGK